MMLNIDICISTCEDLNDLGKCHNRYLEQSSGWVCIIDSDEMFLHPNFHMHLRDAIRKKPDAGLFVCGTNRTGGIGQKWGNDKIDDIAWHTSFAIERYKAYGGQLIDVTDTGIAKSGNLMMTHRDAWEKVGGFDEDRFLGLDTRYWGKIKDSGTGLGLYITKGIITAHQGKIWANSEGNNKGSTFSFTLPL